MPKKPAAFDPAVIEGKEIEVVSSVKLLGLKLASDLTWNDHITEAVKKAIKRLYFLIQIKRARVPPHDLALFYISCVRSVIDHAVPAFYNTLPQYLKNELLSLEKRALSIITSGGSEVPQQLDIRPMLDHYELFCQKLFNTILDDPCNKLRTNLPPLHDDSRYKLRKQHHFNMPRLRTDRTKNTFIFAMLRKFNLKFS